MRLSPLSPLFPLDRALSPPCFARQRVTPPPVLESQARLGSVNGTDACQVPTELKRLWNAGCTRLAAGAFHSVALSYPWRDRDDPAEASKQASVFNPANLGSKELGAAAPETARLGPAGLLRLPRGQGAAGVLAPLEAAFKRVEPGSLSPLAEDRGLLGAKSKRRKEKVREGPGSNPNKRPTDSARWKVTTKPSAVAPAERADVDPLAQMLRQAGR